MRISGMHLRFFRDYTFCRPAVFNASENFFMIAYPIYPQGDIMYCALFFTIFKLFRAIFCTTLLPHAQRFF